MNILIGILKYPPDYAGDGLRLHRTFQRLKKKGRIGDVCVLTSWNQDRPPQEDEVRDGISIFRPVECTLKPKFKKLRYKLGMIFNLFKLVIAYFKQVQKIDLVLTSGSGWFPSLIAWLAWLTQKPIVKETVLLGSDDPLTIQMCKPAWCRWLFLRPFKLAKLIVAISPALEATCLASGIPQEKVWCRLNGVDFKVEERMVKEASNEIPVILWVGAVTPRKNVEFLLRAATFFKSPVRLIFVGPCDDKEYWDELQVIQKNIPQHIQIEFLGLVNDVEELIKLYSNANLFWFASKKEGMGNAVAESLFCGTPVITLPVMGIMKGVITNNEGGEVIDTEDPQVFAAAAMRWLQKPINREAIAKSAQEQFNAERVDLQYMIRIEKLLKQRHKNRPVPAKKFSTSYRLAGIITTLKHFQNIRQRQLDSPEQLRDHQFQCLRVTLKLAFEYIPYYREAYKKVGLVYDDIRTWQDFEKLPILTKTEKRAQPPEAFLPEGIKKELAWTTQTTGSSGIPITIYRNQDSAAKDRALMHYCYSALGIKIYHRFCQLSAVIPDKPNRPGPLARLGLKRSFLLDLRQNESELVRQMNQIKPDVIYGFPSVLLRLAEQIQSQPIQFKTRWIITQGEVLPEPWRATIQQAFSAPVYHTYGATELARVGFECKKQNGYHLISDAAIVEVISDGMKAKTGEEGDLIVTNLNNFISPLIRYEIGDRGILGASACPCGIHYPMLEKVVGRMDDFMILPSGRKVSARAVTHMQFRGILQYKIIQKSPQNFCVLVVPSADFTEQTSSEIRHELISGCLNENIQIEILPVESLPVSRTGKLQIVSREF